jgi:hypothetical protein
MITAKEILLKQGTTKSFISGLESYLESNAISAMKEYAEIKVKEALLEASNKAKIKYNYSSNTDFEYCDEFVDPESILNAYNIEENIK